MTTLYRNAVIVTMDDAGSEHEDGWLLVDWEAYLDFADHHFRRRSP